MECVLEGGFLQDLFSRIFTFKSQIFWKWGNFFGKLETGFNFLYEKIGFFFYILDSDEFLFIILRGEPFHLTESAPQIPAYVGVACRTYCFGVNNDPPKRLGV